MPNVSSEMAYYGITKAGELLGVDPRISYLAGVGIRSTINAGLQSADPNQIWQGITNGLLQGVANIGINYATNEMGLDPLLANLGFSAISTAINAGLQAATGGNQNVFKTIFDTYEQNALTFLGYVEPGKSMSAWQQSAYLSQVLDFSNIVQQRGLVDALNTYGAGFFNAVAVNSIVQSGLTIGDYFKDKLDLGQYVVKLINGKYLAAVKTPTQNEGGYTEGLFGQEAGNGGTLSWKLVGKEEVYGNGKVEVSIGEMGVDPYGKLGYTDADIATIFNSDTQYQRIRDGQQTYVEIQDLQGNSILVIEPTEIGGYNLYNSYGDYVGAKINTQTYYSFSLKGDVLEYKNLDNGATILFKGNSIIDFSIDNSPQFFNNNDMLALLSLSDEDKAKFISAFMTFGHGFNKEAVMGGMPDIMQLFANDLIADGVIGPNSVFGITIYEGNIFENSYRWAKDAWSDDNTLTNKVITQLETCLNSLTPEQRALGITDFTHSGNFRPTIEALNTRTDLNVHTIINYEGPYTGDTLILNPYLQRIINVNGTAPSVTVDNPYMFFRWGVTGPYLDVTQLRYNDAPVPFLGNAEFTSASGTIDNINFEVIGAKHSDFSHITDDSTNIATNFFMRKLTEAAIGRVDWNEDFINRAGITSVSYDENKKVWNYRVDPVEFKRSYE